MSLIIGALWTVLLTGIQFMSLIGLYMLVAFALAALLPLVLPLPGYSVWHALSDTQAIGLIVLAWSFWFGPYSKLVRDVARTLKKAKRRQQED